MRYECDIPGFEDCFVELDDRWNRREVKAFFGTKGDEYLALLADKITALRLCDTVTEPEHLTTDAADDIDMMVWRWFSTAAARCIEDLNTLGEDHARRWLDALATQATAQDKAKLN